MYAPGDQAAQISYIPDSDKILDGVSGIIRSYNKLVDSTNNYSGQTGQSPRLIREYQNLLKPYLSELESCGITLDEQGRMKMDESLASQAAQDGDMEKLIGRDSALNLRLRKKNEEIKLNPMDYIQKKIVSYPDYGKPPKGYSYITSLYSGMLFNYYC